MIYDFLWKKLKRNIKNHTFWWMKYKSLGEHNASALIIMSYCLHIHHSARVCMLCVCFSLPICSIQIEGILNDFYFDLPSKFLFSNSEWWCLFACRLDRIGGMTDTPLLAALIYRNCLAALGWLHWLCWHGYSHIKEASNWLLFFSDVNDDICLHSAD